MDASVKDENGNIYYLAGKLGSGGQGCVFSVCDNDSVVIKALVTGDEDKPDILQDEVKYKEYRNIVRRIMAVGEFENIAVPYVMLQKPYCGYVMLFMNGLQAIDKMMLPYVYKNKKSGNIYIHNPDKTDKIGTKTKEEFDFAYNHAGDIVKRLKCLAKLAKILARFEDKNVVYCDISPNNVYVSRDPDSYEAWLIDLDNLAHASDVRAPIGTNKFMAPEVVNGQKNTIYSDRYSFALLAYQFLMIKEPFLGNAQDDFDSWDSDGGDNDAFDEAVAKGEVAWVWEKDDESNRSSSGLNPHDFLNDELFQLFERTFNADGRKNPTHRPSMWEWYDALVRGSESCFSGTLQFSENTFSALVAEQNNRKYYYQKIKFISTEEPFQKSRKVSRYHVSIKNIVELSDEEGNSEYLAVDEKKIYWDSDKGVSNYYLSNFDILSTVPKKYIPDFIVLSREEKPFGTSNEFSYTCPYKGFEIIAVEDNCRVKTLNDLTKTILYIKHNGKLIKKISISKE